MPSTGLPFWRTNCNPKNPEEDKMLNVLNIFAYI